MSILSRFIGKMGNFGFLGGLSRKLAFGAAIITHLTSLLSTDGEIVKL